MEKYLRNFTEVPPTRLPLLTQWFFFSVLKENFQFSFFLLYSFFNPSLFFEAMQFRQWFDHAVAFNRLSDLKRILKEFTSVHI